MLNTRKWLIIMVAVAFGVTFITSFIMLFSVKKVSVEFSVFGESEADEILQDLEEFKGDNLIFLKLTDVYALNEKYPHYAFSAVEKDYPNVLKITVAKRTEVFKLVSGEKTFVLDGEGYIVNDAGETEYPRNVVPITMEDITVTDGTVGKKIVTSDDELFYSVITTAQSLNLNDSVKEIKITTGATGKLRDAIFTTYTGVSIEVWTVEEDGDAKIRGAFALYERLGDYEKSSYKILAYKQKTDGKIISEWTSRERVE